MDIFIKQLNELINTDKVDRTVFSSVHALISDRVFSKGKDDHNNQIGTYSNSYIKRRIKNNWGPSRKVILQFTGQMKNDFSLIKDSEGFGSGFRNNKNGDKSKWVEETYGKSIFSATTEEERKANDLYARELDKFVGRS